MSHLFHIPPVIKTICSKAYLQTFFLTLILFVQSPGIQRTPSMDFKELTKKDAQTSLSMELDKLVRTLPEGRKHVVEQDFDGFKRLFGKFINETGPSVIWDKIEKLPHGAVSFIRQ